MIIDSHAHLYGPRVTPRAWLQAFADYGSAISTRSSDYVGRKIAEGWFDETGDLLVADMDEAGIDKTVIMAIDFGLYAGTDDDVSLEQRYAIFYEAVQRHPQRLVLYGSVDPRRPGAPDFVQRAVEQWGMKGFKLWCTGVNPQDSACYRVYEKCAALGLPVVVHTGQEITPARTEPTRPVYVDQPSADFPEVTFVLAHAGMAWWEEAASLAWHHPNVYLDTAYWQMKYLTDPAQFARELRGLISTAGKEKVFFGSDWPALRTVRRAKHDAWVQVLRSLPDEAPGGVQFEREEIDLLLGGAAAKALNLE